MEMEPIMDRHIPLIGSPETRAAVKRNLERVRTQMYTAPGMPGFKGNLGGTREYQYYVRPHTWPHLVFRSPEDSPHPAVDWGIRNSEAALREQEASLPGSRPYVYACWSRSRRALLPDPASGVAVSRAFWDGHHAGVNLVRRRMGFAASRSGDLVLSTHSASAATHGQLAGVVTFDACREGADYARPHLHPFENFEIYLEPMKDLPQGLRWLEDVRPDIGPPVERVYGPGRTPPRKSRPISR